jgi:lipid-A-disaccharide synthase
VVSRVLDAGLVADERSRIAPPEGAPRIVILPGSRRSEIHMNMQLLVDAYQTVQRRHPGAVGVILAAKDDLVPLIHESLPAGLPGSLEVVTGNLQGWFDWADLALNASGTVSLDLARQQVPMVAAYRIGLVSFIGSKFVLSMNDRLLPNIVAGHRIVPEFVPHLNGHTPIADSADRLLSDPDAMARTRRDLKKVVELFGLHDPAVESVDAIDEILERSASSDPRGT